jgi:hypothetical protein
MPLFSTLLLIALFGMFLGAIFNRAGESVLATMLAHLSLNITLAVGGASLASVVFWQTLAGEYVLAILAVVALSARPPNVPAIVPVAGKPHDSTAT